ncbi:MAG: glycosyltransferase family 2 protein [Bacteroidota bacterium]
MQDLVSIIMPACNAAPYIGEAIESVIAQSWQNWELIITDDGSVDGTAAVVEQFMATEPRIQMIRQQNGRQGKARNAAMPLARGEFVAFLDADDWWLTRKLELQLNQMNATGADLIFTEAEVWENGVSKGLLGSYHGWLEGESGLEQMLPYNRIPTLTVLARKEAINAVGNFTELVNVQNAEDYHLWLKLLLNGKCLLGLNNTLACYRRHPANATAGDDNAFWPSCEALLELIKSYPRQAILLTPTLQNRLNRRLCTRPFPDKEGEQEVYRMHFECKKQPIPLLIRLALQNSFSPTLAKKIFFKLYA